MKPLTYKQRSHLYDFLDLLHLLGLISLERKREAIVLAFSLPTEVKRP